MNEIPAQYVPQLHELAVRLLEARKPKTDLVHLARELLSVFHDVSRRAGLDALLPLAEDEQNVTALTKQLGTIDLDGGGPRNAKPKQVVDSLITALGLTVVDAPVETIALDDRVRSEVAAALASVLEPELALPRLRDTIIATARARVDEQYFPAFEKMVKDLDERGQRITKQHKISVDAVRAVERSLADARTKLMERVGTVAIDRAKAVLERTNPELAARIDQPVTIRSTPRELTILRAADPRVHKSVAGVVESMLASFAELVRIQWLAAEKPVRTYSPKETFAVGELVEHPKFGRGTVTAVSNSMPRFDVEFADGNKLTLVHVQPRK